MHIVTKCIATSSKGITTNNKKLLVKMHFTLHAFISLFLEIDTVFNLDSPIKSTMSETIIWFICVFKLPPLQTATKLPTWSIFVVFIIRCQNNQ